MTTTSCIISFGSNAIAIKEDGTFSTTSLNAIGNLDDLANDTTALKPFATYEPDFWLLDGNYKFAPASNIHGGYISAAMSPSNPASDFTVAPKIQIDFSELHSTDEITLKFSELTGDWSDKISIGFFNGGTTISTAFYTPTSADYTLTLTVANFNKIEIFFYSQNKAYRYARLSEIIFDELTIFSGSDIKSAKIIEEIDPISTTLTINTLRFEVTTVSANFDITDPAALLLKEGDFVDVRETVDFSIIYMGRFYVDRWENTSESNIAFDCIDAIGLISSQSEKYDGDGWGRAQGEYYPISAAPPDTIGDLIAKIFAISGTEYELDAGLASIDIGADMTNDTGGCFLPISSPRDALQQVAFAIGAFVSCARSKVVRIIPTELASDVVTPDYDYTIGQKGMGGKLTLLPLIGSVQIDEVIVHPGWEANVDAYTGSLAAGSYRFDFNNIMAATFATGVDHSITITGFTSNPNYMEFTVTVAGVFHYIIDNAMIIRKSPKIISVGGFDPKKHKTVVISDVTMVTSETGTTVTQRVYDYYQQRYKQNVKLFAPLSSVGDSVLMDVKTGSRIKGVIEKMVIDLVGGFIADTEIVGVIV